MTQDQLIEDATARTVAEIEADIEAVNSEAMGADDDLAALTAKRYRAIVASDAEAARQLDEQIADARRGVEIVTAKQEGLTAELADAKAAEHAAYLDQRVADAKAARKAAIEALDNVYKPAAEAIVNFMRDWQAAQALIKEVNAELAESEPDRIFGESSSREVPLPSATERAAAAYTVEGKENYVEKWCVQVADGEWVPYVGVFHHDHRTGTRTPAAAGAELRRVKETVPAQEYPSRHLKPFGETVSLPPARIGDAPFWPDNVHVRHFQIG